MTKSNTEETRVTYTKRQLMDSKRYANRRDLLATLLEDGTDYTRQQVDATVEKFMKGKVV